MLRAARRPEPDALTPINEPREEVNHPCPSPRT
jgi:hypothetical protein